jgi:hypothetical protein
MWLKYVDPQEREGEQYRVYEQALMQIQESQMGHAAGRQAAC